MKQTSELKEKQSKFFFENNGIVGSHLTPSGDLFVVDKSNYSNKEADSLAKEMCNSMYACDVFTAMDDFLSEYLIDLYRDIKLKETIGYFNNYYGYIFYQIENER